MTVVKTLCAWLASIVLSAYPAEKMYPDDSVKQTEYVDRVDDIVTDIQEIVYEPSHTSWFGGKWGRAMEAALVTVIASQESGGFDPKVLSGEKRGDKGSSWCLMMLNIGRGKTREGWTGPDLIADRKKCLRSGLESARRSMNSCRKYGALSGLSIYDTGSCIKNESISVGRISKVYYVINKSVPEDEAVMNEIVMTRGQQVASSSTADKRDL